MIDSVNCQFQQNLYNVAVLYGINPETLAPEQLVKAIEAVGQCGAWKIVQALLHGMDYPV